MLQHEKRDPRNVTMMDWIMTAGSVASIAGFVAIAPNHPVITGAAVLTFGALIWANMNR